MTCAAIVLAGGSGTRLQRTENKVYLALAGRPMLAWSLLTFERSPAIDRIVLVVRDGDQARAGEVTRELGLTKLTDTVVGGATRHDSEHAGLEVLADAISAGTTRLVTIHDAARPFVTPALLGDILTAAEEHGGAVPGLELNGEFLLRVEGIDAPSPVPTNDLRRVQTPQAFRAAELLDAYRQASQVGFHGRDTAASVERFSELQVEVVPGDPRNVKVTFVQDLLAAEELAASWDPDGVGGS